MSRFDSGAPALHLASQAVVQHAVQHRVGARVVVDLTPAAASATVFCRPLQQIPSEPSQPRVSSTVVNLSAPSVLLVSDLWWSIDGVTTFEDR